MDDRPWLRGSTRSILVLMASTLAYVAAGAIALWGAAHVLPTRRVVSGFEPLSTDNRRVLVQEWLAEAFIMWGIAAVVVVGTVTHSGSGVDWLYRTMAALLAALAGLTALTGARTAVVVFKICVGLLLGSAALLLAASFL